MRCSSLSTSLMLSCAVLATAMVVPEAAEARTRDLLVADGITYNSSNRCAGNRFLATEDVVIEDFEFWMHSTSGQEIQFYVYENDTQTGAYTQLASNTTQGSVAAGTLDWQNSGPMHANVEAGKYYVLGVCWFNTSTISIRYANPGFVGAVSWAEWEQGVIQTTDATASFTWNNTIADWHMQTYTSPGGALPGGTPVSTASGSYGQSNYVRGNAFDVADDMLLTEVHQFAQVTPTAGTTSVSVPWYIYRCQGTCASGTNYDSVWSATLTATASATQTMWLTATPNIVLEGGYRYFIGIDHTATGPGVNRYYHAPTTADGTNEWGSLVSHAFISGGVPTNPDQVSLTSSQRTVQRVFGFRLEEDTRTTSSTYSGGNTNNRFGNIFSLTTPTRLRDFSMQIDPNYTGVVEVAVYEGTSLSGTYNQLWAGEVEVDSADTAGMFDTPAINIDLDPTALGGTGYYLLVGRLQGSAVLNRHSTGATFPFATSFGQAEAGFWQTGNLDPSMTVTPFSGGRYYGYEVRTCETCVDLDGDGQSLNGGTTDGTDDCDDTNAAMYPGFTATVGGAIVTEICDGFDNDCDGTTPSDETDADGDGFRVCDGDCDDNDASSNPQSTEICDGEDNDCNGTIPSNETDDDGDGFVECILDVEAGTVLGGGDCDDADPGFTPGLPEETCDGLDENCDSYDYIAVTAEPGYDYSTGSDDWYGNVYEVTQDTFVAGLGAELNVSNPGTTLFWSIYRDQGGTYSLEYVATTTVTAAQAGAMMWHDSGIGSAAFGYPLDAGQTYAIGVGWDQTAEFRFNTGPSLPAPSSWGDQIGGAATPVSANPGSFASQLYPYAMSQRVYTAGEFDADGDGVLACEDCDDSDPTVFPGAPEVCDGLDNDCDGSPLATEVDADGDGFLACDDCDDTSAARYPGNTEVCDGIDNDCNGAIPVNELDSDGDGFSPCNGDCSDSDASVNPAASEVCDGLDTDCDGVLPADEIDNDGDGFDECADGDCDDTDPGTNPGASEACDGVDNDCDGVIPSNESDGDGDGERICAGDCDDTNAATNSTASESCDGEDNDCDGTIPSNEADDDGDSARVCDGDCDDGDGSSAPASPRCATATTATATRPRPGPRWTTTATATSSADW